MGSSRGDPRLRVLRPGRFHPKGPRHRRAPGRLRVNHGVASVRPGRGLTRPFRENPVLAKEDRMFDRGFFETDLPAQANEKREFAEDGSVTVKLHLTNGETLVLLSTVKVAEGYAVFGIYSRDKKLRKHTKEDRERGAPQFDVDRLAIAYNFILGVELTTSRQPGKKTIGYQSGSVA